MLHIIRSGARRNRELCRGMPAPGRSTGTIVGEESRRRVRGLRKQNGRAREDPAAVNIARLCFRSASLVRRTRTDP
jgi:hypothetical protein